MNDLRDIFPSNKAGRLLFYCFYGMCVISAILMAFGIFVGICAIFWGIVLLTIFYPVITISILFLILSTLTGWLLNKAK